MSSNATATNKLAEQKQQDWRPGQYWQPGMMIPDGALVVTHDNGTHTLERSGRQGFDPDLREKFTLACEQAFRRSFAEPSEQEPQGRRPWVLVVNREFRRWFPGIRSWGDLEPACETELAADGDDRFNSPHAVKIGGLKAYFDTTQPGQID